MCVFVHSASHPSRKTYYILRILRWRDKSLPSRVHILQCENRHTYSGSRTLRFCAPIFCGPRQNHSFPERHQLTVAPRALHSFEAAIWTRRVICLYPLHHVSQILKRETTNLVFPLASEEYFLVFFCWHFPLPTSPQTTSAPRPLLWSQLPGCFPACSGRGGFCWHEFSWKQGKKSQLEEKHFFLAWERKPGAGSAAPSVPAKNLITQVRRAKSIQPGTWWVGGVQSVPLLHSWDQTTAPVPGIVKFLIRVCCFK